MPQCMVIVDCDKVTSDPDIITTDVDSVIKLEELISGFCLQYFKKWY